MRNLCVDRTTDGTDWDFEKRVSVFCFLCIVIACPRLLGNESWSYGGNYPDRDFCMLSFVDDFFGIKGETRSWGRGDWYISGMEMYRVYHWRSGSNQVWRRFCRGWCNNGGKKFRADSDFDRSYGRCSGNKPSWTGHIHRCGKKERAGYGGGKCSRV